MKQANLRTRSLLAKDTRRIYRFACTLAEDPNFLSLDQSPRLSDEIRWLADRLEEIDDNKRVARVVIDRENDEIVGLAEIVRDYHKRKQERLGWLSASVVPEYRNQGIGTALIKNTLILADNVLGLNTVALNVWGQNQQAKKLYKQLGFEECGRMPGAVDHPEAGVVDEITMYRPLDS